MQSELGSCVRGRRVYSLEGIKLPGEGPTEQRTGGPVKSLFARSEVVPTVPTGLPAVVVGDDNDEGEDDAAGRALRFLRAAEYLQ